MPSLTERQRRAMLAAANDPKIAKQLKIPQSVAREYVRADLRNKGKRK